MSMPVSKCFEVLKKDQRIVQDDLDSLDNKIGETIKTQPPSS